MMTVMMMTIMIPGYNSSLSSPHSFGFVLYYFPSLELDMGVMKAPRSFFDYSLIALANGPLICPDHGAFFILIFF